MPWCAQFRSPAFSCCQSHSHSCSHAHSHSLSPLSLFPSWSQWMKIRQFDGHIERGPLRAPSTTQFRIRAIQNSFMPGFNFLKVTKIALKLLDMLGMLRKNFKKHGSNSEIRVTSSKTKQIVWGKESICNDFGADGSLLTYRVGELGWKFLLGVQWIPSKVYPSILWLGGLLTGQRLLGSTGPQGKFISHSLQKLGPGPFWRRVLR